MGTSVLVYMCTSAPAYRCTRVLVYRCTVMPMYWYTRITLYRCPDVLEYRCTGVPVYHESKPKEVVLVSLEAILKPSWGNLGLIWGPSEGCFSRCAAHLENGHCFYPFRGRLGAILGPLGF